MSTSFEAKSPHRAAQSVVPEHPVNVLIVDDHSLVRFGLRRLIDDEPGFRVVAEEASAEGAMHAVQAQAIDIALVDIGLPGISGLGLVRFLKHRQPQTKSIIVSMHDEDMYAQRSLEAGAKGYLMKDKAASAVIHAMHQVLSGEIYVSEKVRTKTQPRPKGDARHLLSPTDILSDKELEVFLLIGQGMSKGAIAKILRRSVNTIETHRAHIKQKLDVRSSAELARLAFSFCIKR